MTINVLFFASLAVQLNRREMVLELPENSTVHDAFLQMAQQFSDLVAIESRLAFAVNMSYVKGDHPLAHGDELALIPPVSGG